MEEHEKVLFNKLQIRMIFFLAIVFAALIPIVLTASGKDGKDADPSAVASRLADDPIFREKVMSLVREKGNKPDFESDWFLFKSQNGNESYKEIKHELGVLPSRVEVLTKAQDGKNKGFIFEGVGAAMNDDDEGDYGGVVFAYDKTRVRLWAPTLNNGEKGEAQMGFAILVADGWGNEINNQLSHDALVKVRVWR